VISNRHTQLSHLYKTAGGRLDRSRPAALNLSLRRFRDREAGTVASLSAIFIGGR
jgi:hypothetical protein